MVPLIGVALHKVGEIAQSLNFKYLYKSHCKSNELLWTLYTWVLISPQQFSIFNV